MSKYSAIVVLYNAVCTKVVLLVTVKDDTDSAASSLKAGLTQPYVLRQPGCSSS